MNMSHCRFQNTLLDLRDCADHMDDTDLSRDEASARIRLIKVMVDIADNYRDCLRKHRPTDGDGA